MINKVEFIFHHLDILRSDLTIDLDDKLKYNFSILLSRNLYINLRLDMSNEFDVEIENDIKQL